jgi:hypothetical protein
LFIKYLIIITVVPAVLGPELELTLAKTASAGTFLDSAI